MSTFNIGQFRKTNIDSYMTKVSHSIIEVDTEGNYSGAVTFKDKAVKLDGEQNLAANKSYYLNFSINRMKTSEQIIKIYLKTSTDDEDVGEKQLIHTYTIKQGDPQEEVPFEVVITPINNFDEIVFELQRTGDDYGQVNPDRTHGRKIILTINHLTEILNILTKIQVKSLVKVGIQGPTGLLMSINGEEIRVGRTGIYEMEYNIPINSIGFVVRDKIDDPQNQDYFIMDYQY